MLLQPWGIRPPQYVVLLVLDTRDGISQQELCAAARVDSGNMAFLSPLTGLERQQLAATLGKLYATTAEARSEFTGASHQ